MNFTEGMTVEERILQMPKRISNAFVKSLTMQHSITSACSILSTKMREEYRIIDRCLTWRHTAQGHDFWEKIDNLYTYDS